MKPYVLSEPKSRTIVQAYLAAEADEVDRVVYNPLLLTYQSIQQVAQSRRRSDLDTRRGIQGRIGLSMPSPGMLQRLEKQDPALHQHMRELERICQNETLLFRYETTIYEHVAELASALGRKYAIPASEVAQGELFRDTVLKQVFQGRHETERYLGLCLLNPLHGYAVAQKLVALFAARGRRLLSRVQFPSEEASRVLEYALRTYIGDRLDRIYRQD